MPASVLVRLNLPGFASPEPFRLANAPASIAGLACAVLQEIGGFNQEELEAVRNHLDQVPLTLLGELCAGQLVELASDAELGVFLATAESPKGPPIIEVRPRHGAQEASQLSQLSPTTSWQPMTLYESPTPSATSLGGRPLSASPQEQEPRPHNGERISEDQELQEHLRLQQELQLKQRKLQQQQQLLQQQFEKHARERSSEQRIASAPRVSTIPDVDSLPASSHWDAQETETLGRTLQHSPSAPAFVNGSHEKQGPTVRHQMQTSSLRSPLVKSQRPSTPDSQRRRSERDRRGSGQEASSRASSVSSRTLRHHEAPVHERLYQEKDERRRRLEQARLRRLEQEEEDLRMAAQKALGRQPSPARRREPSPGPESLKVETSRGKPPVPERHVDGNDRRSKQLRKPVDGSDDAKLLSLPQNATETSSVASEHLGPQSMASVGTGVEDSSFCGEANGDDQVHRLQQTVSSQQQRIEFLEKMHQQALRQLRTSREELADAQRQRLREADKVLGMEQLISELQVHRLEGGLWEDWLKRARHILEGE